MLRLIEDLQPKEVLALAIAVEEANASRFEALANFYAGCDESLRVLFAQLHDEEVQHAQMLLSEWERRLGSSPRPNVREEDVEGVIEAFDLEDDGSFLNDLKREDALRHVENAEHAAKQFYEEAASRCTDPALHALFLDLAIMEADHADALKKFQE